MKLEELLAYDTIVVQCHNDPDADAIASGWALYLYLQENGKSPRFVYAGPNPIRKSNMTLMVEQLAVPIEHVRGLEEEPSLLVTVDCQYGQRNVEQLPGRTVAVIDHHRADRNTLPPLNEVRDNYGACATLLWDMLADAGFSLRGRQPLCTALYYGLFMDTARLQELRHPKDKDMRDQLEFSCDKNLLFRLQNCNLSLEELKISGEALSGYVYDEKRRFALAEAAPCDPNILGVISDLLIEVDCVDACAVFCTLPGGVKLSVRSSVQQTRADELAAWMAEGCGSGGGHARKAGGFLQRALLPPESLAPAVGDEASPLLHMLHGRVKAYFAEQDLIVAGAPETPDLTGEPLYGKRRIELGYVFATDLFPVGAQMLVRSLEGDMQLTVQEDTCLVLGPDGTVYKNDRAYLESHNDLTEEPYHFTGEYAPTARQAVRALDAPAGKAVPLEPHARKAISRDTSCVHARQLTRRTKVFVSWSDSYMLGLPGDWLVARREDPRDVYVVKAAVFEKTYDPLAR